MIAYENYILVANLEATGLQDLVVYMKRPSSLTFEEVELDGEDIKEAVLGYYNIPIDRQLIQETGTYLFRVEGYELDKVFERECLPRPLSSVPSPDLCIVTGNLKDISGRHNAFDNVEVIVRPLKLPVNFGGTLVLGQRVITRTDYDGFFSLPVIKGSTVIFEIKDAAIRFQAVVPDVDTARIEDLMPSPINP